MSTVSAFDTTLQKTEIWLRDIERELGWDDRHKAYLALRGTLHALRDRLTVNEAAHLGAQLPMLIRGLFYEGWNPSHAPLRERHREQFLEHVRGAFPREPWIDAEEVARGVLKVMANHVDQGEIEDVRAILPTSIKDLLPTR